MTLAASLRFVAVLALALSALLQAGVAGAQPSNDTCARATSINTLPFFDTVDTTDASAGSPSCQGSGQNSVWYRFRSSTTRIIHVSTEGSSYDATVTIRSGQCLEFIKTECTPTQAVGSALDDGDTVYIEVASTSGGGGTLQLTVTDDCADGTCDRGGCASDAELLCGNSARTAPAGCFCDETSLDPEFGDFCPDVCVVCTLRACGDEFCGDGICNLDEDDVSCAGDCGCSADPGLCGTSVPAPAGCLCNADCQGDECCMDRCDADACREEPFCDMCGDGFCDLAGEFGPLEDDASCSADCGCAANPALCGTSDEAPAGCFCDDTCVEVGDCCADRCDPFACSESPVCDFDLDGILDELDNCIEIPNADQRDTDTDGYGNACDADLDQSGLVDFVDLGLLKAVFFSENENADFDGNGRVDFLDLGRMKSLFFMPPGPSAVP